jgi:sugar/nucleoside kinase (ribokinase family)
MSGQRVGFVTGGTWCVDRNKMLAYWPGEDGLVEIESVEQRGGGSGCNFAVDIRKLDPRMPVETIGLVGDDDDGRFLLAEADAFGIDRTQLAVTGELATQYTDAYGSRRSGRRTHIYYPGAASLLTPDHFDFSATRAKILHLGLPGVHRRMDGAWGGDANGWVATLKRARAAGLHTNLELASIGRERLEALGRPCLPHLDTLVVNDVEIGALAGETTVSEGVTDVAACVRSVRAVLAMGPLRLVAAHFPLGAVAAVAGGAVIRQPSLRVPPDQIAAANGAGDAFAAGTLYGVHQGWSVEDSLALGRATAAASLRGLSTTGTVETWQACLAMAREWGVRDDVPL